MERRDFTPSIASRGLCVVNKFAMDVDVPNRETFSSSSEFSSLASPAYSYPYCSFQYCFSFSRSSRFLRLRSDAVDAFANKDDDDLDEDDVSSNVARGSNGGDVVLDTAAVAEVCIASRRRSVFFGTMMMVIIIDNKTALLGEMESTSVFCI